MCICGVADQALTMYVRLGVYFVCICGVADQVSTMSEQGCTCVYFPYAM